MEWSRTNAAMSAKERELVEILAGKPLLTRADIMIRYGITKSTLHRWLRDGFPRPKVKVFGPRWCAADLQRWEKHHGK